MQIVQFPMALVGRLIVALAAAHSDPVFAQVDSGAGAWSGSGVSQRTVDLKWIKILFATSSTFTFDVDARGQVVGIATVIYKLELDDAFLRKFIVEANSASNGMANSLPFGLLGFKNTTELKLATKVMNRGVAVVDIVGMKSSYDELMPVRSGRIKGQLANGVLHLEWAEKPAPLPFSTSRLTNLRSIVISQKDGPAYSPWKVNARVVSIREGQMQAAVEDANVNSGKGEERVSIFWSAVRISLP